MVKLLSFSASLAALTALTTTVSGQFETPADKALIRRDTSAYAPQRVACPPQNPTVRSGATISQNETSWLQQRRSNTIPAMRDFLSRANITGFDVNSYFNTHSSSSGDLPNIGIAVSGGGWRALMIGAGALSAFDNRTANASATGHLGGLLQSATYLAGLSGGSWLVGSLYKNNFDSVSSILGGASNGLGSLWQFDQSILEGPDTISALSYYSTVFTDVEAKSDAGFNTTFTDYWGRFLSFQLFNATNGSPDFRFSQIANSAPFANANAPMPLIVADERQEDQLLIANNATVFEFNPWEMGSYDPGTFAYAPLQYIGSNFNGGSASGSCVVGYDNIGFVVGTSSSLFNQFYLQINSTGESGIIRNALSDILARFGAANEDISLWPNPFYGYNAPSNVHADNQLLTLVDGGEDLQNIPFHPLLRNARDVDVIFAVDGSADTTTNWPNGTAIRATSERLRLYPNDFSTAFPAVPDYNTFVNLGLNNKPTFFGCDNNSNKNMPLVVYLPNAPYTYFSNESTFTLETSDMDRNGMIANAYNMATQANSTRDPNWPRCVGCAILKRSWNRTGTAIPDVCNQCFTNYCWNGTTNTTTPRTYEPTLIVKGAAAAGATGAKTGAAIATSVPFGVVGLTVSVVALFQLFL